MARAFSYDFHDISFLFTKMIYLIFLRFFDGLQSLNDTMLVLLLHLLLHSPENLNLKIFEKNSDFFFGRVFFSSMSSLTSFLTNLW